jgi:hypothetical protein
MSNEINVVENSVKEVLIKLMAEKVMSIGIQSSSMRGVQASPSNSCKSEPSRAANEKRTKHRDDLENIKLIPSILPDYFSPLYGAVNRDSVPKDFEYTLIIVYLPKRICTVKPQQDKLLNLNINEFNLGDHKNFIILTPHIYLTRTKGKKSRIIPQPWNMDLVQLTILNIMKIPHFGRHQEVNACIKLLLSRFHGGYLWLDRRIIVDPVLIHRITGLSIHGPDLQYFYPGKAVDHSLVQKIKDTYSDVEKGKQGYKVASIQNGVVCLTCQLIVGNLDRNKRPMQVTIFVLNLTGKCVEGLQMNWARYLVNQLEQYCHEAQDHGYEFCFSWFLILITFISWDMSEGVTFSKIETYEPFTAKFTML